MENHTKALTGGIVAAILVFGLVAMYLGGNFGGQTSLSGAYPTPTDLVPPAIDDAFFESNSRFSITWSEPANYPTPPPTLEVVFATDPTFAQIEDIQQVPASLEYAHYDYLRNGSTYYARLRINDQTSGRSGWTKSVALTYDSQAPVSFVLDAFPGGIIGSGATISPTIIYGDVFAFDPGIDSYGVNDYTINVSTDFGPRNTGFSGFLPYYQDMPLVANTTGTRYDIYTTADDDQGDANHEDGFPWEDLELEYISPGEQLVGTPASITYTSPRQNEQYLNTPIRIIANFNSQSQNFLYNPAGTENDYQNGQPHPIKIHIWDENNHAVDVVTPEPSSYDSCLSGGSGQAGHLQSCIFDFTLSQFNWSNDQSYAVTISAVTPGGNGIGLQSHAFDGTSVSEDQFQTWSGFSLFNGTYQAPDYAGKVSFTTVHRSQTPPDNETIAPQIDVAGTLPRPFTSNISPDPGLNGASFITPDTQTFTVPLTDDSGIPDGGVEMVVLQHHKFLRSIYTPANPNGLPVTISGNNGDQTRTLQITLPILENALTNPPTFTQDILQQGEIVAIMVVAHDVFGNLSRNIIAFQADGQSPRLQSAEVVGNSSGIANPSDALSMTITDNMAVNPDLTTFAVVEHVSTGTADQSIIHASAVPAVGGDVTITTNPDGKSMTAVYQPSQANYYHGNSIVQFIAYTTDTTGNNRPVYSEFFTAATPPGQTEDIVIDNFIPSSGSLVVNNNNPPTIMAHVSTINGTPLDASSITMEWDRSVTGDFEAVSPVVSGSGSTYNVSFVPTGTLENGTVTMRVSASLANGSLTRNATWSFYVGDVTSQGPSIEISWPGNASDLATYDGVQVGMRDPAGIQSYQIDVLNAQSQVISGNGNGTGQPIHAQVQPNGCSGYSNNTSYDLCIEFTPNTSAGINIWPTGTYTIRASATNNAGQLTDLGSTLRVSTRAPYTFQNFLVLANAFDQPAGQYPDANFYRGQFGQEASSTIDFNDLLELARNYAN